MQKSQLSWINASTHIVEYEASSLDHKEVRNLYNLRRPFVLKNANIGRCVELWQHPEYMKNATDTRVSVHVSSSNRLSFLSGSQKNYQFETLDWNDFINYMYGVEKYDHYIYLRSIGNNPRKQPSDIPASFPKLANDFSLPSEVFQLFCSPESVSCDNQFTLSEIKSNSDKYFSSIFRISMPKMHIWTHYDVMDNVLLQITGKKFVTIFPPSQSEALYMSHKINESSSPVTDIFYPYSGPFDDKEEIYDKEYDPEAQFPRFWNEALPNAMTCVIEPGDILFIPGLWFHNIYALEDSVGLSTGSSVPSISINLFWRNLALSEYDRKDLYGNKDLVKACEAYSLVEKACQLINEIDSNHSSSDFRNFYFDKLNQLMINKRKKE